MASMNRSRQPFGRRLIRIGVPTAVIAAILVGCTNWILEHGCPIEVYEKIPVANSDWVVEKQFRGCALAVDVDFIIQAVNTRTQEVVVIAENDDHSDSKVVNDGPDHVTIRLKNRTPLRPVHDTFGPVHVSYDYLPKDDPADRAAYQRCYSDPRSPENIDWYCKNILAHMDETNQRRWDEVMAYMSFRDSNRKSYCAENR